MNIHFIAGTRIKTPKGHKVSKEGTQTPKTREGKTHPGGKTMRRAFARLERRKADFNAMSTAKQGAHTSPGSMRAN